ncbi:MAG: Hsp20/alpha crystallin family protein [Deltaproteobacteria bacterium]|nr:Hsp20/alpha crystallin family protein [Deltaproteobacteria bacterium]MBW2497502.1 Hsp20/alpha crystallin family protein [Deltaproteobacteria bacterium]
MARLNVQRSWPTAPWSSLFDDIFRAMDPGMSRLGSLSPTTRGVYPPVNLYETEDGFVLTAELPGFAPEDVHVSLEGSTVTVSGERKPENDGLEGASVHRRERPCGSFRRAFELPGEIDGESVEAVYRHGVLMLRIPKSAAHAPREIPVSTS